MSGSSFIVKYDSNNPAALATNTTRYLVMLRYTCKNAHYPFMTKADFMNAGTVADNTLRVKFKTVNFRITNCGAELFGPVDPLKTYFV